MSIYLSLFFNFIKIGLFSFGGAYGAIPLIQETVIQNSWMNEDMFANMIAISESTPGPIMVNAATFIGFTQAGILGSAIATLGVVTPSFVIILLLASLLKNFISNRHFQFVLKGIRPCIVGIILATGIYMVYGLVYNNNIDYKSIIVLVLLTSVSFLYKRIKKKGLSPIILILVSAIMGIFIY